MGPLILLPLLAAAVLKPDQEAKPATAPKMEILRGQVVLVRDWLKKRAIEADEGALGELLALATDDGTLLPLVEDAGSRMFYRDPRLRGRPMQLQGRLLGGTLLQVLVAHSIKDGRPHEMYYWCDVCAIRRPNLEKTNVCECCGGPMELREVPVKK
jgi:hypothetical protein